MSPYFLHECRQVYGLFSFQTLQFCKLRFKNGINFVQSSIFCVKLLHISTFLERHSYISLSKFVESSFSASANFQKQPVFIACECQNLFCFCFISVLFDCQKVPMIFDCEDPNSSSTQINQILIYSFKIGSNLN